MFYYNIIILYKKYSVKKIYLKLYYKYVYIYSSINLYILIIILILIILLSHLTNKKRLK